MKKNEEYKKINIYMSGENLRRLDNYIRTLPDSGSEIGFSNETLSDQRMYMAGLLLDGLLKLIEKLEPARVK